MSKWNVYISSTYKDLYELREILIDIFEKQLKINFKLCELMERMYNKGNYTPLIYDCIKEVELCNIYIIILGNRVGSYPPGENRTYTEIELDTAIAKKKKIFCFVLNNIDQIENNEKAKHQEILNKFTGYYKDFFSNSIELENCIYKSLFPFSSISPINNTNPYKGLAPFNIEDGNNFFGRNAEIEECLKKILNNKDKPFISIIGNSGIGKTSFVQAGVLYKLKNKIELGYSNYQQVIVTPGNEPFSNLKYQLNLKGIELSNLIEENIFDHKIILFFNQFEEIITQCTTEFSIIERNLLLDFLNTLSYKVKSNLLVINTFRSDFSSQMANVRFISDGQIFILSSLDYKTNLNYWEDSIREIIVQPATRNGVSIEEELVISLINDIKEVDGSLPILQFALKKLWNDESIKNGIITSSNYNKLTFGKGISGIIESHSEEVALRITHNGTNKEKESILKCIFINLVEVTQNQLDIKSTIKKEVLFNKLSIFNNEKVNEIYEYLLSEGSRLLVTSEASDKSTNIDIIHEVLVRKWGRLRVWINDRREDLLYKEKICVDALAYNKNQIDPYRGKQLKQALKWHNNNRDLSNQTIEDFLNQSKQAIKVLVYKGTFIFSIILIVIFISYNWYRKINFNNDVTINLKKQINESGGHIDSLQSITIYNDDDLKYFINNIEFFDNINTIKIQNITIDKEINFSKLKKTKSIILSGTLKFSNLKGLEKLKLLTSLEISDNDNLINFKGLPLIMSLRSLIISNNYYLQSLEGINELMNLTSLKISSNDHLFTLSGIEMLKSIDTLVVSYCDNLQTISGIEKLNNLIHFELIDFKNLKSLSGIEKLKRLKSLRIRTNQFTNLSQIEELDSLTILEIHSCSNLINLNGIGKFKNLRSLDVSYNDNLNSLLGIENLISLQSLSISRFTAPINLLGLHRLTSLHSLTLVDIKKLTDLVEIQKLNGLQSLDIRANDNLLSLLGIDKLKSLRSLNIINNDKLKNISQIEKLDSLIYLEIVNNDSLNSISGIANLSSLSSLEISNNYRIKNVRGIENLKGLRFLEIEGDYIMSNLSELQGIEKLQTLKISKNKYFKSLYGIQNYQCLDTLFVFMNDSLSSLTGLDKINNLHLLYFWRNPLLASKEYNNISNVKSLSTDNFKVTYEFISIKNPGIKFSLIEN